MVELIKEVGAMDLGGMVFFAGVGLSIFVYVFVCAIRKLFKNEDIVD